MALFLFVEQSLTLDFFQFFQQQTPSQNPVEGLRSFLLHAHLNTGGPVLQHHGRGNFIYILSAGAGGADELFFNILLQKNRAQGTNPLGPL